jgi:hypothetical protein
VGVGRGELLEQVRAHPRGLLAMTLRTGAARHGGFGAEQALELLGQLAVLRANTSSDPLAEELRHRARLLRERALDLARDLLELRSARSRR